MRWDLWRYGGRQVHQPSGILNLQSSMVKQCYNWIEKFKLGITRESKVIFEIHSILSTSGEKSDAIKAAAVLYTRIIDQHNLKKLELWKEGEQNQGKEEPLSHLNHHMTPPDHLLEQNQDLPQSIQMQWSQKRKRSKSLTLPGSSITNHSELSFDLNYKQLSTCSELGQSTPNKSKPVSSIHRGLPLSLTLSGLTSYRESPSTLTTYFQDSTPLQLTISKQNPLERLNLSLVQKTYPNLSPLLEIGPLCLTSPVTCTSSYLLICRAKELKQYQCYILQQFTTKQESKHPQVIALEWAIHKQVSEHWNLLLSNFDQFNDLQTMHLNHYSATKSGYTVGSSSTNLSDKPLVRKWSEPCQNWNKGVCMRRKTVITSTSAKYVSKRDTLVISAWAKVLWQVLDHRAKQPSKILTCSR